jgi:hypothetical protein
MYAISEEHSDWITAQDENEADDLERASKLLVLAETELMEMGRTKRFHSLKQRALCVVHKNDWKTWLSSF